MACEYCVEDYMLECASCGDKFWEDDLESVDVPWFDQPTAVLLCEECMAETEESQGTDEHFDENAILLAQMEIELPAV